MNKEEIVNKHFNRSLWGYDIYEVDACLDEIIKMFNKMENERQLCNVRINLLMDEIQAHRGMSAKDAAAVDMVLTAEAQVAQDESTAAEAQASQESAVESQTTQDVTIAEPQAEQSYDPISESEEKAR